MTVTRIHEDPRVTKPYTDEQWQAIERSATASTRELAGRRRAPDDGRRADVRLDRRHGRRGVEHGGARPGQAAAGRQLCCAGCATRFAPGGLLHFGQGKWYPGESLPRWAFSCYWRPDGEPLWRDPHAASPIRTRDYGFDADDARALRRGAGRAAGRRSRPRHRRLRGSARTTCARSGSCRSTSIRSTTSSTIREERERLRRVFERGLGTPVGFVLPLAARAGQATVREWQSGPVDACARGICFCVPGDSPMGFRLPLQSLPCGAARRRGAARCDPLAPRASAAGAATLARARRSARPLAPTSRARRDSAAGAALAGRRGRRPTWLVRTALVRRAARRHGSASSCRRSASAEDYLDLVAAIEDTAATLGDAGAGRRLPAAVTIRGSSTSR